MSDEDPLDISDGEPTIQLPDEEVGVETTATYQLTNPFFQTKILSKSALGK